MDDFVLMFLKISGSVWGLFILLLIYARNKGLSFSRQEKRSLLGILIISVPILGWFVFFEDLDFAFDCRKDTHRCVYYHSTIFNSNLRPARSYDLTGIRKTGIVPHKRSCGRYCTKTVYRVKFSGENSSFEMPNDFTFSDDARKQAGRAATFLQTEKTRYFYKNMTEKGANMNLFLILTSTLSLMFAMVGVLTLSVKIFKNLRKEKNNR